MREGGDTHHRDLGMLSLEGLVIDVRREQAIGRRRCPIPMVIAVKGCQNVIVDQPTSVGIPKDITIEQDSRDTWPLRKVFAEILDQLWDRLAKLLNDRKP